MKVEESEKTFKEFLLLLKFDIGFNFYIEKNKDNIIKLSFIFKAKIRQKGSGLGASNLEIDPNDSYKIAAIKSARARYDQSS